MKATTIIIATILSLQLNVLFASNKSISETPVTNENSSISLISFAPTTPVEATFEDDATLMDYDELVPVTPNEATFEDMPSEMISLVNLAPTTPAVADFEDATDTITLDLNALAPLPPAEANFE